MSNPPQFSPAPAPWPPAVKRPKQWLAGISLAVAMLAVCVAIATWYFSSQKDGPAPAPRPPSYTTQQITDAKTKICAAYDKVHHALVLSSARDGGSDPTAVLGVATSGRQVLDAGSRYLMTKLAEEQAALPELATAIRNLANAYEELAISYLDGLTNSDAELQPVLQAADDASATIERLCK